MRRYPLIIGFISSLSVGLACLSASWAEPLSTSLPEPGTDEAKPGADGAKPGADGAKPGADGAKPGAGGLKPGADGAKPIAGGVKPGADGVKPGADGAKPESEQAKPPGRMFGAIKREATLDTPAENSAGSVVTTETLKPNMILRGGVKHTSLFAKIHHQKMTAEDFRRLEYGVLGLVAINRVLIPTLPVVTEVFPTCPAAIAGIRPGDVLVSEDGYRYRPGAGQKEVWATLGGKAGSKVSLTVRRRNQFLTFDLIRMNIEDIQNDHIRHTFESILRQYGPPGSSRADDN